MSSADRTSELRGLVLQFVPHQSPVYWQTVALRHEVLRKPLGLKFSDEELLAENEQLHLAALKDREVLGCLVLKPYDADEIKMRQVAVAPKWSGKGIGQRMVAFAEQYSRQNGYKLMTLHARQSAVAYYLKLNYEQEGEEFTEVTLPHVKMKKLLAGGEV